MARAVHRVQPPADHVHRLVDSWRRERPDLAVEPLEIVYRINRLAAHFAAEVEKVFAGTPITPADFAVISILQRSGPPHELGQRRLMEELGLTSGTVSVRIDRLQRGGLVERHPDPADARGVLVALTDSGRQLFDQLAPVHLANEARLVAALDPPERAELARMLQILLVEFETRPERPGAEIGLAVTPAHTGIERRSSLGLPPAEGLLVEAVVPGSPAAAAGLRAGDVLTHTGTRPMRSLSCLASALAAGGPVTVRYRRGDIADRVTLRPRQ